jgi:hypothetical protein
MKSKGIGAQNKPGKLRITYTWLFKNLALQHCFFKKRKTALAEHGFMFDATLSIAIWSILRTC